MTRKASTRSVATPRPLRLTCSSWSAVSPACWARRADARPAAALSVKGRRKCVHHHVRLDLVFARFPQRRSPIVQHHAGVLGSDDRRVRCGHGGRQAIQFLSHLADDLGAVRRLIVALRAHRAVFEPHPRVNRALDPVVAMTRQASGCPMASKMTCLGLARKSSASRWWHCEQTLATDETPGGTAP